MYEHPAPMHTDSSDPRLESAIRWWKEGRRHAQPAIRTVICTLAQQIDRGIATPDKRLSDVLADALEASGYLSATVDARLTCAAFADRFDDAELLVESWCQVKAPPMGD